jgi:hypothetical protein
MGFVRPPLRPAALPTHAVAFLGPCRDQICSLNFSLTNLYFIGCVYSTGFGPDWNQQCGTQGPHWGARVALSMAPFFCRFVQSLRRWYDSRLTAHLINVGNSRLLVPDVDLHVHRLHRPGNTRPVC